MIVFLLCLIAAILLFGPDGVLALFIVWLYVVAVLVFIAMLIGFIALLAG